jgi:broad specificity phosphatase PhoE
MATLILVRHSNSQIVEHLPAHEWHLSEEGRARCKLLAERLSVHKPELVVASVEPKATETGQLVAGHLKLPFENALNLHEHERSQVPYRSQEIFEASVHEFFAQPDELVFGDETAEQAYSRFASAVEKVVESHPKKTIALITHGTVMTLFIARRNPQIDAFDFWKRLDMPAYAVLSLPHFEILAFCESID